MASISTPIPAPARPAPHPLARSAWFGPNMRFARWGLIINLLVPVEVLIWDAAHHTLGVNAVNYAIHTTGLIAILYLLLSLAVTPLRAITGFNWLVQFRRSLGVYAFYYAAAHLTIYFWWDRGHSVSGTVYEITHRYYLAIGFASLAIMAPLWATSFDAAIRWMGGRKWKNLHRLTYVAAACACVHYYLQSKSDKRKPELYLAILGGLLLWRVGAAVVRRVRMPAKAAAPSATAVALKPTRWQGDLKVVGVFRETPSVRTFRLEPPDGGPLPFTFSAGQFLTLSLEIDGKRVSRSYTIASPPTRDSYIELTVKREDGGHVSHYLHDRLVSGQFVGISAAAGRFVFSPKSDTGVLLIAGGVGITPAMSIVRDLTDRCWAGAIDLIFSVRSAADVIFAAELEFLAARHPNLHVHKTITRDAPADWAGPRTRITVDLLRQLVPDFAGRRAFVCGPDAMARAVRDELRSAGVSEDRVTLESFTPAPARPSSPSSDVARGQSAVVIFSRSNATVSIRTDQTVLDAAEAAGVPIDYQCRAGICGTCRCKLLDGSITMAERAALSDADEADGYILACQAYAQGDLSIDA